VFPTALASATRQVNNDHKMLKWEASARLRPRLKDYGSYHQTAGNKATHVIGIPIIMLSLIGLLSQIVLVPAEGQVPPLDAGVVLVLAGLVFYYSLDWKIALPFTLIGIGFYAIGSALSWQVNMGLQIGGWIIQFVGHAVWEKKSPAFIKNLTHLLIGPLFIFSEVTGYRFK
jgi:uncharacterized membrane protein YGL010W